MLHPCMVAVEVVGTSEASGPIFPPPITEMDESTFASCRQAVEAAAAEAGISMQQLPAMVSVGKCGVRMGLARGKGMQLSCRQAVEAAAAEADMSMLQLPTVVSVGAAGAWRQGGFWQG